MLISSGRPSSQCSEILQVLIDHRGVLDRNGPFRMFPSALFSPHHYKELEGPC